MLTNFAALTAQEKIVWSRDVWEDARDQMFINKFTSTDENTVIQRITELTRDERGESVKMHLVADLVDDGVVGDDEREGREEEMSSYDEDITIDLISHGVRQKGKLAEQKTVIRFREQSKNKLSYWLANRMDQLAFLTLSGIGYEYNNDGSNRTSAAFSTMAFAADVSAPTSGRHVRVHGDATGYLGLEAGDVTAVDQYGTLTYSALVDLGTYAKTQYVKPLTAGGKEYYVLFMRPEAIAQLKKDPDFQRAVITGLPRSEQNPFFTGGTVTVDGLVIHEHRLVYNTKGAAATYKWGGTVGVDANQDGSRALLCGAQALGMADLGVPEWSEKWFNYDSSPGVNVDKMFGYLKPKFHSNYSDSVEDFGVIAVDHAINVV
jgi:N4-gp56 family major capsid protein